MSEPPRPNRARYVWHVISVAGHDREGVEPFPVARLRLVRQLDEVLDLFDTEPRFRHFTLDGQSILLEDYLTIRPENFERVERAVQEGKLLVGPWYVQPEPLLVSPESVIRNLMIGLRTARVFGPPMLVGYLEHWQGLSGYLPQILKGFGIETAIIPRSASDQPMEAIWEGDDKTQIVVGAMENTEGALAVQRDELAPYSETGHLMLRYKWSMEHTPQNRLTVLSSLPFAQNILQDDAFHSSPTAYAKAVRIYAQSNPLPFFVPYPLDEKWQQQRPLAQDIPARYEEAYLLLTQQVEPALVWAENRDIHENDQHIRRPQTLLQTLWRMLLENQYPSIWRGVANMQAYNDVEQRFNHIFQTAHCLLQTAFARSQSDPLPLMDLRQIIQVSEESKAFQVTTTKLPEDSTCTGMIVRGYNTTDEPLWVTLTPWRPFTTVDVVTLDEEPTGGRLAVEANGAIQFKAAPHRILTFWFHDNGETPTG